MLGGGQGTATEIDYATTMGKRIVPFAASGGAAAKFAAEAASDAEQRSWLGDDDFQTLIACAAEDYAKQVHQLTRSDIIGGVNQ